MVDIAGYNVTIVSTTPRHESFAKLMEYYLEKHKDELTAQILQEHRNLMLYGCTHPELVYKELFNG